MEKVASSKAFKGNKVLIVAHRGEPVLAPENTMAGFELAWKNGDAAIEVDVYLTKDRQVVVCHDADTYRTSGNKTRVILKDSTLAEIQKVDVGSFHGSKFAGQHCPALKDVYAAMPAGNICYTEIKSGIDVVPALVDVFKSSGKSADEVVVISFHAEAVDASKKALPQLKHYLLDNFEQDKLTKQWLTRPNVDDFIEAAKKVHADGLNLAAQPPLDRAACRKVRDAGLELHVWATSRPDKADASIDLPELASQYLDFGVQSMTVNRAGWLREQLFGTAG